MFRYMFGQLAIGMVFVTIGLTCVIWLTQSLRFVEMIVNRGLTTGTFLYLTMLLLPSFLSMILPVALFAVVVFVYDKMITDREIVVMRGAGMSQNALARPALALALVVVAFGYLLNLFLLPESYRLFRELQWEIRYNYSHILLQEGTFNTLNNNFTVYVRERTEDAEMAGILVHDTRTPDKPKTYMATRGTMVNSRSGPRLVVFDGHLQEWDAKTHKLSILYFDRTTFEIATPSDGGIRYREPQERSLYELFHPETDAHLEAKDFGKLIVEGHRRLTWPLHALTFTLIGLACMISGGFDRKLQTGRVILAVTIVVFLQAGILGLENLCARKLDLVPLIYVNAVVPLIVGMVAIQRSRAWRSRRRRAPATP